MSHADQSESPLVPGLKVATWVIAQRIKQLEDDIVTHDRAGNGMQAFYAAHTATYLRQLLAEFIGPTWHTWAQAAWPTTGRSFKGTDER